MRARALSLLAFVLASCSPPPPATTLDAALKAARTESHTFQGRATRTVSPGALSKAVVVSWDVTGTYAAPWAQVEMKTTGRQRTAWGKDGWWVEASREVWRAFPAPHEVLEWLDPAALAGHAWGKEVDIGGASCRHIEANHPAGRLSFDIRKSDSRILRASGALTDQSDLYGFETTFAWGPRTLTPPAEAALVLDALTGARPAGDDPAARAAAVQALRDAARASVSIDMLQIDCGGRVHQRTQRGYIEQFHPWRALNIAEGTGSVFLFTDGTRTVAADWPQGPIRESENVKPTTPEEVEKLVGAAEFRGEMDFRGVKCRIVAMRVASGKNSEEGSATGWLWISPDGKLQRHLIVGKLQLGGEAPRDITTYVDFVYTHKIPDSELIRRAQQLLPR